MMETLLSEESVFKLCEYLIENLETNEDSKDQITSCINGLNYICYGQPEDHPCLTKLDLEEKLFCLLQVNFNVFNFKPKDCIDIANSIVALPHLTVKVCKILQKLISAVLKNDWARKYDTLIKKLFQHPDFPLLTVDVIEDIMILDSKELELILINTYTQRLEKKDNFLWNCESQKHWVTWCCNSPKLFSIITSIMNQLLMIFKNKLFLEIIQNFVVSVSQFCSEEKIDFVKLYPLRLQPLVSVVNLEKEVTLSEDEINELTNYLLEEITFLRQKNPFEALIVCSHFKRAYSLIERNVSSFL